jgi:hypothetical protein
MLLDAYELPGNLYWSDEFDFIPFAQSKERTVSGGMVVESAALQAGQPVTLTADWADRDVVLALRAMQADISTVRVLTLNDGVQLSVLFDVEAGGVEADLLSPELNPTSETIYELTIHLVTVTTE